MDVIEYFVILTCMKTISYVHTAIGALVEAKYHQLKVITLTTQVYML